MRLLLGIICGFFSILLATLAGNFNSFSGSEAQNAAWHQGTWAFGAQSRRVRKRALEACFPHERCPSGRSGLDFRCFTMYKYKFKA